MQILKVVPYSAIQLCTYELAKRRLRNADGHLSVPARLAAGAFAGMTATLVGFQAPMACKDHPWEYMLSQTIRHLSLPN